MFPSSSSRVLLISISLEVLNPVLTFTTQNRLHSICRAWGTRNLSSCITIWQNRQLLHPFLLQHPCLAVCHRLSWPQLNHSFVWLSSSWKVWSCPVKAVLYHSFNIFLLMFLILFFQLIPSFVYLSRAQLFGKLMCLNSAKFTPPGFILGVALLLCGCRRCWPDNLSAWFTTWTLQLITVRLK